MFSSFSKLTWVLKRIMRSIRVKVISFALFGFATAAAAYFLKDFIPDDLPAKVGADAVGSILQVLASSMLTVTTFSLSILTAAYANAAGNSSPRAVRLLIDDGFSQTVLASFMGAFVFSIVGISLLPTGVYGEAGRLVLFGATLAVVAVVVGALLRWISSLTDLGRVGDNLNRIENAASQSLALHLKQPACGGQMLMSDPPGDVTPIYTEEIGYIQHIAYAALSSFAEKHELDLYLTAMVGDFVTPGAPIMSLRATGRYEEEILELGQKIVASYAIDHARSFDQDPRFGVIVLSEVGQRALSPGINDPGTAEEAIARIIRVLGKWRSADPVVEITYPRLWVPPVEPGKMLELGIAPLARDGAGNFDLQLALQRALLALAQMAPDHFAAAASDLSRLALSYSDDEIPIESQRARLAALSEQLATLAERMAA